MEGEEPRDGTAGGRAEGPAPCEDAVGTRAHVRRTLERARRSLEVARERTTQSRALAARAEALADASALAVRDSVALRSQLRASVTAYVQRLRAEGVPPERMLVLVKAAVREASPPQPGLDPAQDRGLMADVVRWSVEGYYAA